MFTCIPVALGWSIVATFAVIDLIFGIALGKFIVKVVRERREEENELEEA